MPTIPLLDLKNGLQDNYDDSKRIFPGNVYNSAYELVIGLWTILETHIKKLQKFHPITHHRISSMKFLKMYQ